MINYFVMVGRFISISRYCDNKKIVCLNCPDSRNNDITLEIIVSNNIGENVEHFCEKGDIIGFKGKVGNKNRLIAEKVTFISSKHSESISND